MDNIISLSQIVVEKNREAIEYIIRFYGENNESPAYIRIETGTYGRLIINPLLELRLFLKLSGAEDKISSLNAEMEMEIVIENFFMPPDEYWSKACDPYTLCSRIHGVKSKESKLLKTLPKYSGLVVIDYESEGVRETFKPVVITL